MSERRKKEAGAVPGKQFRYPGQKGNGASRYTVTWEGQDGPRRFLQRASLQVRAFPPSLFDPTLPGADGHGSITVEDVEFIFADFPEAKPGDTVRIEYQAGKVVRRLLNGREIWRDPEYKETT